MSALGHKQTCAMQKAMSALPPIATSNATYGNVRYGPKADIAPFIRSSRRRAAEDEKVCRVREPLRS